jgi:hypothetical protein
VSVMFPRMRMHAAVAGYSLRRVPVVWQQKARRSGLYELPSLRI